MAARRRPAYNKQLYNGQAYVYGNTVRKPEIVPGRYEEQEQRRARQHAQKLRLRQRRALRLNAVYVVFLTIAAVIALCVCVNYLKLRSEIARNSKNITYLQKELAEKREINDTRFNNAADSVNLDEVRKQAMGKMKMTYAKPDQIITYKNPTGNYVKQYKNIPKNGVSAQNK